MKYIRGKFKQLIFESDNGYKVGLFRIKETNQEEMEEYVNKTITFTGYFADLPYNIFSKQRREKKDADRSIVRPAFSFYGKLLIADTAIESIIEIIANKMLGVDKVTDVKIRRRTDSKGITISLEVVLFYGVQIFTITRQLQAKIKEKVEYMTAMQVKNVNVSIRSLSVKKEKVL